MANNLDEINGQVDVNLLDSGQMALFFVGNETFGIVINKIKEIVRVPIITSVPNAPSFLVGLANLRGRVLPVIDARKRLGIEHADVTDASRILVIENGENTTGILVDRVKGVSSIEGLTIEEPPAIISSGLDRKFIKSVIKNGNGEKIVMEFETANFCAIDLNYVSSKSDVSSKKEMDFSLENQTLDFDEIQMVTFNVSNEEYGFPIEKVNEVLRVGDITAVPNTHEYIEGILTVRDSVLPIIDIRKLFGMHSLVLDLYAQIDYIINQNEYWYNQVKSAVDTKSNFRGILDSEQSLLGIWIVNFRSVSETIGKVIQDLRYINFKLFSETNELFDIMKSNNNEDYLTFLNEVVFVEFQSLKTKVDELKDAIKRGIIEDQRIMVVEINHLPVGILVDRIQQVIRVPKKVMENPPIIINNDRSEVLKSIAKIDDGKRIILLLDENSLIEETAIEVLKNINLKNETMADLTSIVSIDNDEIQLVTFKLGAEEFAVGIEEVQEINRVDEITAIPQSQVYIDGVMNLRGNVIPVINLRKRFGLEFKEHDEASRVIIVTILNKQTGLIVDSVSEVLRIPSKNIESTPDLMAQDTKTSFLKGVGKSKETGKMLLLISIDKILSSEEQKELIATTKTISKKVISEKTDVVNIEVNDSETKIEISENKDSENKDVENPKKKINPLKKSR